MQILHVFDETGKNISSISKKGNGTGEYIYITEVGFNLADTTIKLYDNGNKKIIHYDIHGKLLDEISVKNKETGNLALLSYDEIIGHRGFEKSSQVITFGEELN